MKEFWEDSFFCFPLSPELGDEGGKGSGYLLAFILPAGPCSAVQPASVGLVFCPRGGCILVVPGTYHYIVLWICRMLWILWKMINYWCEFLHPPTIFYLASVLRESEQRLELHYPRAEMFFT